MSCNVIIITPNYTFDKQSVCCYLTVSHCTLSSCLFTLLLLKCWFQIKKYSTQVTKVICATIHLLWFCISTPTACCITNGAEVEVLCWTTAFFLPLLSHQNTSVMFPNTMHISNEDYCRRWNSILAHYFLFFSWGLGRKAQWIGKKTEQDI